MSGPVTSSKFKEKRGSEEGPDYVSESREKIREERRKKREQLKADQDHECHDTRKCPSFLDSHKKLLLESNPSNTGIFYRPVKATKSLLSAFINHENQLVKNDLTIGSNGKTKDEHLMQEVRQKLLVFASKIKYSKHPMFPDIKCHAFTAGTTTKVVHGLMELETKQDMPASRDFKIYLAFRVLMGIVEVTTDETKERKLVAGDELHVRPGLGFKMRNPSRYDVAILYFRGRKVVQPEEIMPESSNVPEGAMNSVDNTINS